MSQHAAPTPTLDTLNPAIADLPTAYAAHLSPMGRMLGLTGAVVEAAWVDPDSEGHLSLYLRVDTPHGVARLAITTLPTDDDAPEAWTVTDESGAVYLDRSAAVRAVVEGVWGD